MAADKNAGIGQAADNLSDTFEGINRMTDGYRRLTEQTPGALNSVDNLFADNSETMVQLLGSLTTTSQLLYLRVPALNALFPNYRGSVLDAIGSVMHDNGLWTTGDIYPRYACEYGNPRRPPSSAGLSGTPLHTYCRDDDPGVLIRGAKNAPRPASNDTAGAATRRRFGQNHRPDAEGQIHRSHAIWGPGAAHRATQMSPPLCSEETNMTLMPDEMTDDEKPEDEAEDAQDLDESVDATVDPEEKPEERKRKRSRIQRPRS